MNTPFSGAFSAAINAENALGFVAVIPDIKCISPKHGDLLRGRNPVEMAQDFIRCGAPILSVVTEREHFGGSPELLSAITNTISVPVLRKDFITNEDMLTETVSLGAKAILLICAIIDTVTMKTLYDKAIKLGLEPLVEVRNKQEMEFANTLGAQLIGINNREITTFECDNGSPDKTVALASNAHSNALLISESGVLSAEDAKLASSAGANAILVGTALWQAKDTRVAYNSLRVERN